MAATVLLTLGRLPKALALARALHNAGCRVLIAEPFRWHLCRPSRCVDQCFRVTAPNHDLERYLDELLAIVRDEHVDLVLPVSEEALHVAQLAGRLPGETRLGSADATMLRTLHDKWHFVQYCEARGLAAPATALLGDPVAGMLAQADFVVKPRHACSGIGVELHDAGTPLPTYRDGMLVQQRLAGDVLSSLSLFQEGRELGRVIYRGLVFAGTVAVCFERVDDAASAGHWLDRFAGGFDGSGFVAFDFITGRDGVARAIECNPRVTSGVHFFEAGALATALLSPTTAGPLRIRPGPRFQWAYSTLTEAYAALPDLREFRKRLGLLRRSRDVVWDRADPWPFLLMTPMSWEILWPAMTGELSLGEATQQDIAWFGDSGPPRRSGRP